MPWGLQISTGVMGVVSMFGVITGGLITLSIKKYSGLHFPPYKTACNTSETAPCRGIGRAV